MAEPARVKENDGSRWSVTVKPLSGGSFMFTVRVGDWFDIGITPTEPAAYTEAQACVCTLRRMAREWGVW